MARPDHLPLLVVIRNERMPMHPNRSKKVQAERKSCFQSPLVHTTINVSIIFPPLFSKRNVPLWGDSARGQAARTSRLERHRLYAFARDLLLNEATVLAREFQRRPVFLS